MFWDSVKCFGGMGSGWSGVLDDFLNMDELNELRCNACLFIGEMGGT